jgi:type I restriction enzyme, S subunit
VSEWSEVTLGRLCKFQAGDAFPKDQQGLSIGEYPFIKVSDMNLPGNERFIQRSNNWIRRTDVSKYRLHPPGSVVFAKIGEALRANRRRVLVRETIIDNNMMSAVPNGGINPSFLLYLLEGIDFNDISRGSALPYLAASDLNKLTVKIPSNKVQQAIAETLSLLDQKIELNRRMNETLEGMAQAIFRDWFIDFGPVRRKAAGDADPVAIMGGLIPDPARAAELSALFPATFSDDGLPVGWSLRTVESVVELAYGKALPKTVRNAGPYPVYGSGGISGTHSAALVRGPGIIVGRKGTVGSLFWEAGGFFAIDTVFYVVPKDGVPLTFAWYLLQTLGLEGMNTDAAVPGLNRGNVYRLEFAFGDSSLLDAFKAIAGPLRARQDASNSETLTLAETRDYLLPRLMSGMVRVAPKAEVV